VFNPRVSLWEKIWNSRADKSKPEHLRRGETGELAAKRHLQKLGLKFLAANYRSERGEIDLIFRDEDCLVFVEVKTRAAGGWTRPCAVVMGRLGLDLRSRFEQCGRSRMGEGPTAVSRSRAVVVEGAAAAEVAQGDGKAVRLVDSATDRRISALDAQTLACAAG